MTTHTDDQPGGLTRRQIIAGGAAAATGAAALGTALTGGTAGATATTGLAPQALSPAITGLTYQAIDGVAFAVASPNPAAYRYWEDITGAHPEPPSDWIYTSLDLPVGAVIKQINAVYQGQPIVSIRERNFATGAITDVYTPTSMAASPGGPFSSSTEVSPNVTIKPDCSYQLRFFCLAAVSIMGATVGYSPASFAAITPKRVLDTRPGNGGAGKVQPGQEVTIDLSTTTPFGSAAVVNITADQPAGVGYLSAYSADIAYPGTSVLNFSPATPNIANGAIVTMGAGSKIKVRAGADGAATDVIVDVVGYLL